MIKLIQNVHDVKSRPVKAIQKCIIENIKRSTLLSLMNIYLTV